MPTTLDAIRAFVAQHLGPTPTTRQRRELIRALRQVASEQQEQIGRRRKSPGGPLGAGVRWTGKHLLIGRAVYQALGEPRSIRFEIAGTTTRIIPLPTDEGEYLVTEKPGMTPRATCRQASQRGKWERGWHPVEIEDGTAVFQARAARP